MTRAPAAAPGRAAGSPGTMASAMAEHDEIPLEQQIEEIGVQLDWVRGYL